MKYLRISIFSVSAFLLAGSAFALDNNPTPSSPIKDATGVQNWLVGITKWGFRIFFILAVGFVLLAAYKYLMAKDNQAEVTKATAALKNAVIAIAIALVSAGVSSIVDSALRIQ